MQQKSKKKKKLPIYQSFSSNNMFNDLIPKELQLLLAWSDWPTFSVTRLHFCMPLWWHRSFEPSLSFRQTPTRPVELLKQGVNSSCMVYAASMISNLIHVSKFLKQQHIPSHLCRFWWQIRRHVEVRGTKTNYWPINGWKLGELLHCLRCCPNRGWRVCPGTFHGLCATKWLRYIAVTVRFCTYPLRQALPRWLDTVRPRTLSRSGCWAQSWTRTRTRTHLRDRRSRTWAFWKTSSSFRLFLFFLPPNAVLFH